MTKTNRVILTAGGGGHTGYAYALAQELYGKVELVILVTKGDALTYERMKQFGEVIEMTKPREPTTKSYLTFAKGLIKSFFESLNAVKKGDVVVSCGSNFAIFPLFVGWLRGNKTVNLETSVRFVRASKTPKILQHFATVTALQWWEQQSLFPQSGTVFGPILAKQLVEPKDMGYILVTGGTFGNKSLFNAMFKTNLKNVVMQVGPLFSEDIIKQALQKENWTIIDYSTEFHKLIAGASVVVTHFGETILEAAFIYGKPVLICPNPDWFLTAGVPDAEVMARKTNGVLVEPKHLGQIEGLILNAQKPPTVQSGTESLCRCIVDLAER